MTKQKPAGSQDWMALQTDAPEDPEMYMKPPGDYDLKAAQASPELAGIYLQYIAEDISQGKQLSPTAKRYHDDCWRRVADGEKLDIAFNLAGKGGRTESTVERNIDIAGQYCARINEGELHKDIIEDFWEDYGILESTLSAARCQHGEFCEEHIYLWSKGKILDDEMYDAGKIRRAEYIQQCKSKDMKTDSGVKKKKRQNAPRRILPNTEAQEIYSAWLLGKNKE